MVQLSQLDNVVNFLFALGFITSKLSYSPFILLIPYSQPISLLCYGIGYILWLLISKLSPSTPAQSHAWYGFAEFKDQHQLAAILGIAAVFCYAAALTMPMAFLVSGWLFALSDIIWCIGEYHKNQSLPKNAPTREDPWKKVTFRYSLLASEFALLNALTTTLTIFFPPVSILMLYTWGLVTAIIGIQTIYFFVNFMQQVPVSSAPNTTTYSSVCRDLVGKDGHNNNLQPQSLNNFVAGEVKKTSEIFPTPLSPQPTPLKNFEDNATTVPTLYP